MAFQLSPGVSVNEIDQTTVVPSVSTTAGAFAGYFNWGPVNKIIQITNEVNLVQRFGKPSNDSASSFFSAANFLAYGDNLNIVRAVGSSARNATGGTALTIQNSDVFQATYLNSNNGGSYGSFVARYPGAIGNSLAVSVCFKASDFSAWAYKGYFSSAPGTSQAASLAGGQNDEMHIVVIDNNGSFSGQVGTVLETFAFVSKAGNATINGVSNYYKNVIFNTSKYVFAIDPVDYTHQNATWGNPVTTNFDETNSTGDTNLIILSGGVDSVPADSDLQNAFDLFINKEYIDISLIVTGAVSATIQNHVITAIVAARGDCVAFVSPPQTAVVNQAGSEVTNITSWLASLGTTSTFAFADSGWKYQYDKYNSTYRWVPLNGDIAGLCVYTDTISDAWFSPAGYTRGQVKNAIKLAWNPNKTQRDTI